ASSHGRTHEARKTNRTRPALYPNAKSDLAFDTPFQLLIATVLSAQTTDIRVNAVTPGLFAAFPDAHSLAVANLIEVEELIRSTGFYRSKARNIVKLADDLVETHDETGRASCR